MLHLKFRGAIYREAHSPEEAKGLIDKTCQDVLDLLGSMAVLVRQCRTLGMMSWPCQSCLPG